MLAHVPYGGATPGADSSDYTLFDTSAVPGAAQNQYRTYRLVLNNSAAGTLKVYYKTAANATPVLGQSIPVSAALTNALNRFEFRITSHKFVKVVWTNGGSAQSTFTVLQSLSDDAYTTPVHSETEARVRGPVADATNNLPLQVGTTHTTITCPTLWLGRRVNVTVRGASGAAATCWVLFGTSSAVEVDRTVFATGTPPAFTGNAKAGMPIRDGENRDFYVDPAWTHISLEADTANTEVFVCLSDYAQGEI